MEATADSRLDFGKLEFGCKHYQRRCRIRAACYNEIFGCCHCHNESTIDRHKLCQHDVKKDDDTEKGQYHCDDCGICRVGVRGNFFHCKKCGCSYDFCREER